MLWSRYAAILFDLDGVITPTAEIHLRAWRETFDPLLTTRPGQRPFSDEDYFAHIDGRTRIDGVRDFLASRGLRFAEGSAGDPPEADTVHGIGARKNKAFTLILHRDGVTPYPGSMRLIRHAAGKGLKLGIVSSSRNARLVLHAASLDDWFAVVVDGSAAAAGHLAGKPAPDTFLRAARLLGETPTRCVVIEDSVPGVVAGVAGRFGAVVGVDRGAGGAELAAAGAGVVVHDLGELVDP